ncbi:hypothetical protein K8R42_02910 [bacterium]|nr:hypothetical protein [bacterium]
MTKKIKRHKGNIYSKIVGFFLFLTVLAIFVILHFALAKVTIKIYNNLQNKQASVLIEIQSEDATDLSPDAVLGKIIKTEFELSTTVASSQEAVDSKKAGGYVTIYNNYSKSQPLVKTTRLLTPDNKLFRISEGVTVPVGGQVEVWAEADQEGTQFVTEATKFTIPGLWVGLQDKIYAETNLGMTLQSVPEFVVTQKNMNQAQEQIKIQATSQGLATINELLSDNLKISKERLIIDFEILESSQVGDISQEALLKQKVTIHGLVFDQATLVKKAKEKYSKDLDGNQSVVQFIEDKFSYEIIEINLEKNEAVLEVNLEAKLSSNETIWDLDKNKLMGQDEFGIRQYLDELKVEQAEIKFFPFWVKKAPNIKDHIIVE